MPLLDTPVTIGVPSAIGRFSIIYALYSQECLQHTFHSNGSYRLGSSDNIHTYIIPYYYIINT